MPTVKLADEDDPNPLVQKLFADMMRTKGVANIADIW
jgi:hypothetical protein